MKHLLFALMLFAFAKTSQAQAFQDFEIELRDSVPYMVTAQNPQGVQVDTVQLRSQLDEIKYSEEELAIREAEIKLIKDKRALAARKDLIISVIEKTTQKCAAQ